MFTIWNESEEGSFTLRKECKFDFYYKGHFKFSKDGNLMVLVTEEDQIAIYDSSDIDQLTEKVAKKETIKVFKNQHFATSKLTTFSRDGSILAVFWDRKVMLYTVKDEI